MIERQSPEVWDILEEVTMGHPVLLNRAPTLHRLSIQAFEPVLIEGEAIRVHPLVCTAYNADFDEEEPNGGSCAFVCRGTDGSQIVDDGSQQYFQPISGKPIMTPTQDITLGCYYLTAEPREQKKKGQRLGLLRNKRRSDFRL